MSKRSKLKRDARQAKCKMRHRAYESNVSNVGGLFAINSAYVRGGEQQPLMPEQAQDIKLAARLAYDNMLRGQSTSHDWGMVTSAIDTALMLAEQDYGKEHEDVFIRAQEALIHCYQRGTNKGIWRFDGAGMQDVGTALDLYEQQCDLVSQGDIKKALAEVERRVLTGNTYQVVAA